MFASSTQLEHWTFSGATELRKLRAEANHRFQCQYGQNMDAAEKQAYFLSAEEESAIFAHYEYVLQEFCSNFQPPMPRSTMGTSMVFFKRFYLHNSVMDYHPQDILYICAYLACKVEEFNVSIIQFVANLKCDNGDKMADMILSQELLLMQQLHYHLTVHNPFRPLEGLLIDIKTRCPTVEDAEILRKGAEEFINKSLHTDAALMFAPSQIALAAVLQSGARNSILLDHYVANTLLASGRKEKVQKTTELLQRIRSMNNSLKNPDRTQVRVLDEKLHKCRNQDNNPFSIEYQSKLEDLARIEYDNIKPQPEDLDRGDTFIQTDILGLKDKNNPLNDGI